MKIGAFISRTDSIKKKLGGSDIIEKALVRSMQNSTLAVHRAAVKSLQQHSAGGKPEFRYNPKRLVVPAPPGSPPNTDTGRLVQSVAFEFDDGGRVGLVGTNVKYGSYLEFGTEKMEARPWLGPALNSVSKDVADKIQKGINDGILKAFGVKDIVKDVKGFSKSAGRSVKRTSKSIKRGVKKIKRATKKGLKKVF